MVLSPRIQLEETMMFRSILRSLKAALRAMACLVGGVWTSVFGGGGGDVIIDDDDGLPAPDAQPEKTVENYALADHDLRLAQRRAAALIYAYAADAQVDGVRPEMPPGLSRAVKAWLPGLTLHDLRALTEAGRNGIRAHIGKGPYIAGVHRVNPLPPVTLEERIPEHEFEEESALRDMPMAPREVPYLWSLMP
jgi:hypothetical protein